MLKNTFFKVIIIPPLKYFVVKLREIHLHLEDDDKVTKLCSWP